MRRAPYASITLKSVSESSGKFRLYFALNFVCDSTESALQPTTAVLRAEKSFDGVAKLGRFVGSTGCIGLGKK